MELDYDPRPRPAHWQDSSPPSASYLAQRRRSSAASARPAAPPPNLPIPSLPTIPAEQHTTRPARATSFARPIPSPNLTAVAAFSQARQASSSMAHDDLSDPPPASYLTQSSLPRQPDHAPLDQTPDNSTLSPTSSRPGSAHRPSSRTALTRALALARRAVQLDSTNDNPEAAVHAYAQSVALLSEVMERVRNGEDNNPEGSRRRRRRSAAAQEDEVRRLQNIHDTYADRMNILSLIYRIPTIPYGSTSASTYQAASNDSTLSTSPTTSASPSSDDSPRIPGNHHIQSLTDDSHSDHLAHHSQDTQLSSNDGVYTLDESVLTGSAISDLSPTQHPYAVPYDPSPQLQQQPQSISSPAQPSAPVRNSILVRRSRAPSTLPPKPPPPSDSLPQPPVLQDIPAPEPPKRHDSLRTRPEMGHRRNGSGLGALEEEDLIDSGTPTHFEIQPPTGNDNTFENYRYNSEISQIATSKESPPLPPLPSPPLVPEYTPNRASISRSPPSPRVATIIAPRPRGSSTLTTRHELANVPQMGQPSQGSLMQARNNKNSAPPSTRSSSPAESTTSAGSVPFVRAPLVQVANMPQGRLRSSSQPGRRPSIIGGRASPDHQLPPLPGAVGVNGIPRKVSVPSKLGPGQPVHVDPTMVQLQQPASTFQPHAMTSFSNTLLPMSPLPPPPPSDPLLQPYHLMSLLRITMTASTGGYVTPRLHVPCEVWSQGGAKLSNLDEKIRVVTILCSALEELQMGSGEAFGNGIGVGRKEADVWLAKLDEFSNVCDHVVANFGKKLGVGEGFVARKTTWGDKWTRRLDKFTNGKNLDAPTAYVQGLRKLFAHAQLLDEHTCAVFAQPVGQVYSGFPVEARVAAEQRLRQVSEFFAKVVLTFIIRDLSLLLDKYVKSWGKLLAE